VIDLPGACEFAELSRGRCHYRLSGPEDGKVLLMLHGATVPGWEFERLLPYLNDAGYRTVCPDLYGHGYSSRPKVCHDHNLFVAQSEELLDLLEIEKPIAVFGHSLGAAIGAQLASRRPEAIDSIVLTAPLLDFRSVQPAMRILNVPVIGELLVHAYVVPMLKRRRSRRYRDIDDGRFVRMYREQFLLDGFGRALLSLIRSGALGDQSDGYERLRGLGTGILVLRGLDDSIFTADQLDRLKGILPEAQVHQLEGMGHPLMLTHPEIVSSLVIDFLDRRERRTHQPPNAGYGKTTAS
jgi:pimeloyl-ACP methyl ester carboxylesterase